MAPRISQLDEARLAILQPLRQRLEDATHGTKSQLVATAAERLCCSPAQVYADLKALGYGPVRKRRSDAGSSVLTEQEVHDVATILTSAYRDNNKRLMAIEAAMEHARANGLLHAPASVTTMSRRMRSLHVHPEQYERPKAHRNMRSKHPNHVWEVDPSLCVMYYLPTGQVGVERLDDKLVYKNKLDNLGELAKRKKVWRYVQWDHYSSAFFFRYYETPGESAEVLLQFLIDAALRKQGMAMHGWPELLLWDKGSANTSAPVRNMLNALGVNHQTHKARRARVKGGVEGCNNLIECGFESQLRFAEIPSVAMLNARADDWQIDYNSWRIQRRTRKPRYAVWQTIRQEQLHVCEDVERLRLAANFEPVARKVNGDLTVSFNGQCYSVEAIGELSAGDLVQVSMNLYSRESVWVHYRDKDGIDRRGACALVTRDEASGFLANAVVIGEDYTALADRPVDVARKDLREAAWGSRDENEAIAARNKGRLAMDGRVDPFAAVEQRKASLPHQLPRRGTELNVPDQVQLDVRPMSHVDALFALRARLGRAVTSQESAQLREWYPEGVPEHEFDTLMQRLTQPQSERPRLSVVGGAN